LIALMLPADCDEGMDTDARTRNSRSGVAGEYYRICTGFGTIVDYSIAIQLHGDPEYITLARFDDDSYPTFRWVNDDRLVVRYGKAHFSWWWWPSHKIGNIRITYESSADPAR
jgi:hypothetical protein